MQLLIFFNFCSEACLTLWVIRLLRPWDRCGGRPDLQQLKNSKTHSCSYLKCHWFAVLAGRQRIQAVSRQVRSRLLKPEQDFLHFNFPNIPISINLLAAIVGTTECSVKVWLHSWMKFCNSLVPRKIFHKDSKGKLLSRIERVGNNIWVHNTQGLMGECNKWSPPN